MTDTIVIPASAIAKICHEANKAYCESLGDTSQVHWDEAPDNIKQSAINGVEAILNGTVTQPSDSHNNWLEFKKNDGWKYGPVKDAEKKEHPCFVPYEKLPEDQKLKDALFWNVANTFIIPF